MVIFDLWFTCTCTHTVTLFLIWMDDWFLQSLHIFRCNQEVHLWSHRFSN